jgi:hypothetical protein
VTGHGNDFLPMALAHPCTEGEGDRGRGVAVTDPLAFGAALGRLTKTLLTPPVLATWGVVKEDWARASWMEWKLGSRVSQWQPGGALMAVAERAVHDRGHSQGFLVFHHCKWSQASALVL